MSTDKAMVTDEMVDAAVSALDITVYGKDTKEKMRKAISAAIYANRSCGGFSSAALAQAEQPVAWGVFRDGQMIGWVPGPDEDAEFKLPEDTDERRPLYAHPPAKREADEQDSCCPICAVPFKPDDICASDITEGTCHAACLEGSPVVDLDTGEEIPGGRFDTYPYSDVADLGRALQDKEAKE